jgi:hypothetical protein
LSGRVEAEREGDRVECGLVLDMRYRGQPSPRRLPIEREERSAVPPDGERLLYERHVDMLVKIDDEASAVCSMSLAPCPARR